MNYADAKAGERLLILLEGLTPGDVIEMQNSVMKWDPNFKPESLAIKELESKSHIIRISSSAVIWR